MTFADHFARNLRKPTAGVYGKLIRFALTANKPLERNAVKVLRIQPHHKVLEVGFGPGHGIKYTMMTGIPDGTGKFVGVDFSQAMCDDAKKNFAKDIANGKVEILNENVASMSLPDNEFDKVFHTNSHLYWPDLSAACKELYRVMKPNADMVTVMDLIRIRKFSGKSRALKYATNILPEPYMESLAECGFTGIDVVEVKRPVIYSLYAIICKKPLNQIQRE